MSSEFRLAESDSTESWCLLKVLSLATQVSKMFTRVDQQADVCHFSHLVGLVQGLLPVIQLLIQVAFLFTEQFLKHRGPGLGLRHSDLVTSALGALGEIPLTFSLSRSTILRCSADSVSSILWSHWAQTVNR